MNIPYNSAVINRLESTLVNSVSAYSASGSTGGCPRCGNAMLFNPVAMESNCAALIVEGSSPPTDEFNVVLVSATVSPKQIPVGGNTTLSVSLQNTGTVQAPAGCIVEILANSVVIGEVTAPAIPAGEYYNFNGTLTGNVAGPATICARIKSGYYNTLPQQKCDTITVGGDIPAGDFYIELRSVALEPNPADIGENVNMIIMLTNTGTETAPAGWILQIKRNGIVVGESQPAPEVLPGHTVRGDVNFSEGAAGTYSFCARIKEGYYDIPPQEKCATLTVGQVPTGGIVNVSSTPSGAGVYMDSLYKGVTTIRIENVEPGQHSISIKKDGYKDYNTTITVTSGVVTNVTATLEEEGEEPLPIPPFNYLMLLGVAGIGLLGGIMMTSDKDKYKPSPKK